MMTMLNQKQTLNSVIFFLLKNRNLRQFGYLCQNWYEICESKGSMGQDPC